MKITECTKTSTHILVLDGERFPIYHKERRLYSFVDWKDSRDKLIKIMLAKIKRETGENTAFIDFKMANPMRKTRLGNFFIDLIADVKVKGKSLGTLEELGMKNICVDRFETLDLDELEIRSERETMHSQVEYNKEFSLRLNILSNRKNTDLIDLNQSQECLSNIVRTAMKKEGWSTTLDNRSFARIKRSMLI
jgi:hypothetical protein